MEHVLFARIIEKITLFLGFSFSYGFVQRSTTALEYAKIRRCYEIMALLKNDL
jgi:hypothetical protein